MSTHVQKKRTWKIQFNIFSGLLTYYDKILKWHLFQLSFNNLKEYYVGNAKFKYILQV